MNRLIAYRANEPERLRAAALSERSVLFPEVSDEDLAADAAPDQSGQPGQSGSRDITPKARWGVGYYIGGQPQVQRFAASPVQGLAALKGLRADVVLAQVAAPGAPSVPPYRYGPYLLGLHGEVPRLDVQQSELTQALPAFLHYNLRDHSAGERLLHLVCARLHQAAPEYLQDAGVPPEVAVAALAEVLHAVAGPGAGAQATASPLTMTMTNGDWLVVAQHGGPAIWYRPLAGVALGEGDARSESYRGVWAMGHPGTDPQSATAAGWKQIPADHALVVGSDITFQILPLS